MRPGLSLSLRVALAVGGASFVAGSLPHAAVLCAQAPTAPASSSVRAVGTVKSVGAGSITVGTDKGESTVFTLPDSVRVVQLAPGSTDLKTAQAATVNDIATGDRVLVTGRPADAGTPTAVRVVLMKSGAIAQNNAARQQDWQHRGSGGTVKSVDASAKTITLAVGPRTEVVTTTPATMFRRYAPGSVKFEDAKVGALADIAPGDQVRVRGDRSADGTTVAAEEVVSGAFRNLAGTVSKVDAAAGTVTLNDLATKKPVVVTLASDTDLRALPPEMAARFAARARGGAAGAAGAGAPGGRPGYAAGAGAGTTAPGSASSPTAPAGEAGAAAGGRPYAAGPGGAVRSGGGDLSQVIGRLPKQTIADLKPGEAVMVVASGSSASSGGLTAITLLSGVEPLLTAAPGSANSFSISPWSLGGGGGEGGGEGGGPQ